MPTIDLIHLDAGGQRAAAHALKGALRRQGQAWTVRPVALPQLLDPSGRLGRLAGRLPERLLLLRLRCWWRVALLLLLLLLCR